jgi:hypothetical protein
MVMCDGTAHFLSDEIDFDTWRRLAQPDDGKAMSLP